ncbi:MAG: hypothetical protein ACR2JC_09290 [Chloroflexota bacterium]
MLTDERVRAGARDPSRASTPWRAVPSISTLVPSLYQVAALAVLGAILIIGLAPRLDTDFWWHLKDGSYIAARHVVPSHDFMSYTFRGHAWTDHEWLAELILYGLYRLAGLWGPIVFFAAIICATFALVYANMALRGLNKVLALFILAGAFVESTASWGPRIQMMTLFFLSAYMLLLIRYEQTRDRRLLLFFPALMVVWTNVHGGFVLGLAVLALTLAGETINRARHHENALEAGELKLLGFALAACVAVTMINPNGVRQLLYPLTFILPNAYTNLIEESASPNFHMPVMMVFEGMLLLLISVFYASKARLNWTHLFLIIAFTHLAFSQVRNVPLWSVVVAPLLALYVQQMLPVSTRIRRPMKGGMKSVINMALLALVLLVYVTEGTHFINGITLRQAETQNYPAGAIAYMGHHRLPPHVFVSYGWAGYMLWHLFPRYQDYMDSRADTLYNRKILTGYLDMYAAHANWRHALQTFGVQTVLVERNAPLSQVLAEDRSWRLAYRDTATMLYYHRR